MSKATKYPQDCCLRHRIGFPTCAGVNEDLAGEALNPDNYDRIKWRYEKLRDLASHEDKLINKRLGWMFAFSGLVLTSEGLVIGAILRANNPEILHVAWWPLLFFFVCSILVGGMMCTFAWRIISLTSMALDRIHTDWVLLFVSREELEGSAPNAPSQSDLEKRMAAYPRLYGIGGFPDSLHVDSSRRFWCLMPWAVGALILAAGTVGVAILAGVAIL